MTDTRIVYGANCVWWDSICKVGHFDSKSGIALPCCPHCGSVLFELPNEDSWWEGVDKYEADGHPGYRAMIEWSRGKCFRTHAAMQKAYAERDNTP